MNVYFLIIILLNLILFSNFNKISKLYNLFDYPDKFRKKHQKPTSLLGGLVIFINLFVYSLTEYFGFFELIFFKIKKIF